MRGVRCAVKRILKAICPLLAKAAFLPASGQCSVQRQQTRFTGAGNSAGPFARPQQRFRAARGLCSRPSPSLPRGKTSRIRSIFGSSTPSGFEAGPGRILRRKPVIRSRLPRFHCFGDLHSPTGRCSRSDQSGQSLPQRKARFATRPIVLHSPQRTQFDSRFGSTFGTRFVSLSESFREPWN